MKPSPRVARSGLPRRLAPAILAVLAACEAAPEPGAVRPEPTLHGASLVVGTSADQWSLISVPRDGGLAETRDLSDLQRVVWTGVTELPASKEVHALSDGWLVLRTAEGIVHTYDPASDALVRVGEVSPEAVWLDGGSVGLYYSPDGSLLEVSREGVWSYGVAEAVLWAAPVEDGVLVVLAGSGERRTVWLLRREEDSPAETGSAPVNAPGVVTAWGRRAVLTSSDGRGLIVLTAAPIEQAGEVSMGGRVLGLAASPSTHEIYVAVDDPPRLEAVNRFALSTRVLADLPSPVTDMRPSLFGDAIFVAYGSDIGRVPAGGGAISPVASVWRADLPVGLPDGTVLTGSEEGIGVTDPVSGTASLIEGAGPGRWWLPIRWNPTSPIIATDRVSGELVRPDTEEVVRPGAGVDSTLVVQRPTAAPGRRDEPAAERDAPGPPPGFYAIVGSARQSEGIRSLTASLEDAGFLTQVHRFRDEAGRTWYRGLVGPFRSRSEAEAASRQLLRERRLEAWVTEIGASGRPAEEPI